MSSILEIRTGDIRQYQKNGKTFDSAYVKTPVKSPVNLSYEGLTGDVQADKSVHGGIDKAILLAGADSYVRCKEALGQSVEHGAFGENLIITGQSEQTVHIGDEYLIGNALIEVSQPRQPCFKVQSVIGPEMLKFIIATHITGWYCRVLKPGTIKAGMGLELTNRKSGHSINSLTKMLKKPSDFDKTVLEEVSQLPCLADSFKKDLAKKLS